MLYFMYCSTHWSHPCIRRMFEIISLLLTAPAIFSLFEILVWVYSPAFLSVSVCISLEVRRRFLPVHYLFFCTGASGVGVNELRKRLIKLNPSTFQGPVPRMCLLLNTCEVFLQKSNEPVLLILNDNKKRALHLKKKKKYMFLFCLFLNIWNIIMDCVWGWLWDLKSPVGLQLSPVWYNYLWEVSCDFQIRSMTYWLLHSWKKK